MDSKDKRAIYKAEWFQANKEFCQERMKVSYENNREQRLKVAREHYEKNKEAKKEYGKQYYQKNKEKNKERDKASQKIYSQTDAGKKSSRIRNWKQRGIVFGDYDLLYEIYLGTTNCDVCYRELTEDRIRKGTTRSLDHDHQTGDVRGVVCHGCNIRLG